MSINLYPASSFSSDGSEYSVGTSALDGETGLEAWLCLFLECIRVTDPPSYPVAFSYAFSLLLYSK